jgi:diguanylate cyclase (GGDEF)-like protein/PAS domain S-box-containing protein
VSALPPEEDFPSSIGDAASGWGDAAWRKALAQHWAVLLSDTAYIPMSHEALSAYLYELVEIIAAALDNVEEIEEVGHEVGSRLVRIHATGQDSLDKSMKLLRNTLLVDHHPEPGHNVIALLTAMAAGYAGADRQNTFEQQETLKRALLRSKLQTDRELEVVESRFREVFTSTPVGVAICDPAGKFVEVNPALVDTVGRSAQELAAMSIHDLFTEPEAQYLATRFAELAKGGTHRLRERCQLQRADGDEAFVYLAVSVLRAPDGSPRHFVAIVQDTSELHLLQERFQHQALHDAMTGLPNRQFFRTRLEAALANLPDDARLTMYHLGLDGFELINDGLGHEIGDMVVKAVARRLESLIGGDEAMVARFGGTEFAILVQDSPTTPDIGTFSAMINEELSEPIYVGDDGTATSASIGVVQRVVSDEEPVDMMWAAEVALRRAKAAGKRQWALFDPDRAPSERIEAKLAAVIPGALELGEFGVVYQPVITMADGRLAGFEAHLCWQPEGHEPFGHHECLGLAERSGVTLSLRDWLLRATWQQMDSWFAEGLRTRLVIDLSPHQCQDPDLVAVVRSVLRDLEVDPTSLWLSMPVRALLDGHDEVRENVEVLSELGVQLTLHDFHASPEEIRHLRTLPVNSVRLAAELVDLVHGSAHENTPEVQAIAQMVPLLRSCDVWVVVDGVHTEEQARHWHAMGCDAGVGPHYGEPIVAEDVPGYLARSPLA